MNTYNVPYGSKVSVQIVRENGLAHVDVIAPLYKNKKWRMSHCYDAEHFTDHMILKDHNFVTIMIKAYPRCSCPRCT